MNHRARMESTLSGASVPTRDSRVARAAIWLCVFALALSFAGCGGGGAAEQSEMVWAESGGESDRFIEPEIEVDPAQLATQQADEERRLSEVLAQREPDCPSACDLGTSICDLAQRICRIAERRSSDSEIALRCEEAGNRCEAARERISEHCSCD